MLAPHGRSGQALSTAYVNRVVFSRLEKPPGAGRPAPAGRQIRAPAAGPDGIHARVFDGLVVGERSTHREAPALL